MRLPQHNHVCLDVPIAWVLGQALPPGIICNGARVAGMNNDVDSLGCVGEIVGSLGCVGEDVDSRGEDVDSLG